MRTMVIIRFSYTCPREELEAMARDFAERVKPTIEGLIWKIFVHRPDERRGGGVYLFRDLGAARGYVDGAIVKGLREAPVLREVTVEVFDAMEEVSALAGAPMG